MKAMTLANLVTLSRLIFLVPVVYFLVSGQRLLAVITLGLVLFGDLIDGAIARHRNEVSELGKILDPLVDKLVFISIFVALAAMGEIEPAALILLLVFQAGIVAGALHQYFRDQAIQGARPLGKTASLIISVGLVAIILEISWSNWILYGGILLGYIAGFDYLINWTRTLKERHQDRSRAESSPPHSEEVP